MTKVESIIDYYNYCFKPFKYYRVQSGSTYNGDLLQKYDNPVRREKEFQKWRKERRGCYGEIVMVKFINSDL